LLIQNKHLYLYQQTQTTMKIIDKVNEQVKQILGDRYDVSYNNGVVVRFSGAKIGNSMALDLIGEKAGFEVKKQIAKEFLMINFGR